MNNKNHIFFSLLLVTLLSTCASPQKQKVFNIETLRYEGIITPIKIPIKPEYKPVQGNFKILAITEKNGKIIGGEQIVEGRMNVSEMGSLLIWDAQLLKWKTEKLQLSPSVPLFDVRVLTDKYGQVMESEISSPEANRLGVSLEKQKGMKQDMINKLNRV